MVLIVLLLIALMLVLALGRFESEHHRENGLTDHLAAVPRPPKVDLQWLKKCLQ